jgi:DNA-binding NtrC family response regulator
MPVMNGLDLLRQIVQPRFMRVLLTGQATTDEAVEAFNDGLIDMYLQKRDGLVAEVRQACERGDHRHRNLSWHRVDPVVCSAIKQPEGWAVVS